MQAILQRRLFTAISIAKRVAMERICECGTLVGYQIGLDRQLDTQINSDTRILFCTTGVLVQRLINEKTMKRYTHVILDEVRSLQSSHVYLNINYFVTCRCTSGTLIWTCY